MSELAESRRKISQEIRHKHREQIKSQIRNSIINDLNTKYPLISSAFECFWECSHWQLLHSRQKVKQVIESTCFLELSDQQHQEAVTDLFYMVCELSIDLPANIQFKKNEDSYTASLVSLASAELDQNEIAYWIQYMSDSDQEMMLLNINAQNYSHNKWVQSKKLFHWILQQTKSNLQAATTFRQILLKSEALSKNDIKQSIGYIKQSLIVNQYSQNVQLRRMLIQIWIDYIQIYAKIKGDAGEVRDMVLFLKASITSDVRILLSLTTSQELNQLYQLVMEDYILPDDGCQILLQNLLSRILKNQFQADISQQDINLFRLYIFRLCYNNWRAKQLTNKKYSYTPKTYEIIQRINNGRTDNPYFYKLMNVRSV